MVLRMGLLRLWYVALLAEGVGRNKAARRSVAWKAVALLTEGVGRNAPVRQFELRDRVALLTEGVGRNEECTVAPRADGKSPSSRRAWVEISAYRCWPPGTLRSPSSRRAWVEILPGSLEKVPFRVALLTEGVGRNQRSRCRAEKYLSSPSSRRAWVEI